VPETDSFLDVADLAILLDVTMASPIRSQTSYRNLLQTCAFSYQRPATQYKSHAALKVMEFETPGKKLVDTTQNAPSAQLT
jgi:hypothetical protein